MQRKIMRIISLRALALVALTIALGSLTTTYAQPGPGMRRPAKPIPSERYYSGVNLITDGRFSDAVRFYENEIRNGMKIGASLWIDSICYYAMIGEAYYQSGSYDEALKNYNAALNIAMTFPSWQSRVTYTLGVTQEPKVSAPWGATRRDCPVGFCPRKATILIGEGETAAHQQLGVVAEQRAIPIDPVEIIRCTALCIRRRTEIIGPLSPFDPMSGRIMEVFSKRYVAINHWSNALLDVVWGLALEGCDKRANAVKSLSGSLMMAGQCDHNLTGVALYELGELFLKDSKLRQAAECYYEAAISAYHYGDDLLLEESLRKYSNTSKAFRRGGSDPAITASYRWAKGRNIALLTTSLGLELVEDFINVGKFKLARSGLAAIQSGMRGGLSATRHAERWNYLDALLCYGSGDARGGDLALDRVVEGSRSRSLWVRQLSKLDGFVQRGFSSSDALTPRNAIELYDLLLREPTVVDWAVFPTESLSIQMIAPIAAYERQFALLLDRDLKDRAFEVAERIRRERFFSTQTFGGRLLSLRYILTADDALSTPSLRAVRESLLFEYPDFAETVKASDAVNAELAAMPTIPADKPAKERQAALFAQLTEISARQEALLRFIAARRVRIPYVFPPVLSVEEVQKRLPEDTAILAFIAAEGDIYGFMIGHANLDAWRVGKIENVSQVVSIFLKTLGNQDGSRQVDAAELAAARWKTQGSKLRDILLGASDAEAERFNIVFSKLVVVPDAALWYLPFEALCLPKAAATVEEAPELDEKREPAVSNAANTDAANTDAREEQSGDDQARQTDDDATNETEEEFELDVSYLDEDAPDDSETEPAANAASNSDAEPPAQREEPQEDIESDSPEDATSSRAPEVQDASAPPRRKSASLRKKEALDAYEASLMPMIEAADFTIRYSATASLALPNALGRNSFVETTLIVGGNSLREKQEEEKLEAAVARFASAVSKTEASSPKVMANIPGSVYASRLRRLVVWEEVVANNWNWDPIVLGKCNVGNSVSDWISSPWGAPRLLVMPALRTHAEDALKRGGVGLELFLPTLALQASGADTMLLSRWRTGGRSAYDLSQVFVERYEQEPAALAWKRAVVSIMKRDVVPDEEPRLRKLGRFEEIPQYDAPFWWAGYMLIDSGEAARPEDLERFDEDAVKKAEEENALLDAEEDGNETDGQESDAIPIVTVPGQTDDKNEQKKDDEESTFSLTPDEIKDEELSKLDEEGEDFFAPNEPVSAEPKNSNPAKDENPNEKPSVDSPSGVSTTDKPTAPAAEPPKADVPKTDAPKADAGKDDKSEGKSKTATGRLKLQGKGKTK